MLRFNNERKNENKKVMKQHTDTNDGDRKPSAKVQKMKGKKQASISLTAKKQTVIRS